jgi:ABC-2 type transport system ATP-binding protein
MTNGNFSRSRYSFTMKKSPAWITSILATALLMALGPFTAQKALAETVNISSTKVLTAPGIFIDTSLYLPHQVPAPAVLLAHGFGETKSSVTTEANALQKAGYVVLTWSARGFGSSTGTISMDAPNAEIADISKLIDFLAKRKDVLQTGGKPIVGIAGSSYGGAAALMTAGLDHRIRAVAANITWNNLNSALFPESTTSVTTSGPFKKYWTGTFFALGSLSAPLAGSCGGFSSAWCNAYKYVVVHGKPDSATVALLNYSSPSTIASQITVPTLLMQGEADSLFPLSESNKTAQEILAAHPHTPLAMIWHGGGHDGGTDESARLIRGTIKWFDIYLRGRSATFPKFQVTDSNGAISLTDSTVIPVIKSSNQYPFQASSKSLQISPTFAAVIAPINGIPAAVSALPGLGSAISITGGAAAFLPGESAFFDSLPLEKPRSIVGSSHVLVHVSSSAKDATLFFSLVVRTSSGMTKQPNGIVAPVYLPNIPAAGRNYEITLPTVVLDAAIGDRLAVAVSSTDQGYALPIDGRAYTVNTIGNLNIPQLLVKSEISKSSHLRWPITALIFLILCLLLIYFLRIRRAKDIESSSDVLVRIKNLSKVYKDGYQAVSDISFDVERGQIVGLLGPNGAGKTTIMRMLMGLIFPTEGRITLDNEVIYPGSPALSRLGSFVEGPGFLPHMTGRQNLDLYWRSIGRDDNPYLERAIEITGLGNALDKKVRSYSQGMRQRLAIAQSMLGLPDLLVLDEPTNGLDPQQIKAMREVLKAYANTGRTVVISSHLLAEVQQTCTHVVLMHRGNLIAFGPMKEILKRKGRQMDTLEEIFLELIGDDLIIGKDSP